MVYDDTMYRLSFWRKELMLYFETYDNGSNNWVVFLHGIGGSTKTWKKQIDDFKDYNLLLIDLPGHGQSKDDENITVFHVNYKI